jgi:putative transposase
VGYDAGKKIKGRKRFILTDTQGFLLSVLVCAASVSEKAGDPNIDYFQYCSVPRKILRF